MFNVCCGIFQVDHGACYIIPNRQWSVTWMTRTGYPSGRCRHGRPPKSSAMPHQESCSTETSRSQPTSPRDRISSSLMITQNGYRTRSNWKTTNDDRMTAKQVTRSTMSHDKMLCVQIVPDQFEQAMRHTSRHEEPDRIISERY